MWSRKWEPTPVFLPGKPMDQGAWQAIVHGIARGQTQLSNQTTITAIMTFIYFNINICGSKETTLKLTLRDGIFHRSQCL